jgi:ubiquinone/menaquinone biosynthesis C-methylase UbiE
MRVKYDWDVQYPSPEYWSTRTPLHIGMPKFFHFYQDLNDKKLRAFLSKERRKKARILDAGCGEGRFVAYADVGADFSKGMLGRAKGRHQDISFVRASLLHLPFKDRAFSTAFTVDVLLHILPERRKDAINEMNRVSEDCYHFLAEHRTVTPFIFELFRTLPAKPFWWVIPYIAVFLAFPFDRFRKLEIDSGAEVLKKLAS